MSVLQFYFFDIIESVKWFEDIKMRKDIKEIMKMYKKEGIKPNLSAYIKGNVMFSCEKTIVFETKNLTS